MSAVTTNLTLVRGDTDALTVTVGNLGASGLNAFSDVRFTAKRDASDADSAAIISKVLGAGITITTVGNATTDGVLSIAIAPADTTTTLPAGYTVTLVYDVRLYDASGDAYTVAQGVITVSPTATQATS